MPKSLLVLLLTFCVALTSRAAVDPAVAQKVYDDVSKSLVVVQYTWESELGRQEVNGTGVVVSADGLVMSTMTITPVSIPDAQMKEFKIILPDEEQTEIDAEFQGRDERTNTTFVKAKEKHEWKPLKFVDKPVKIGDTVLSVGLLPKAAGYKPYLTQPNVSSILRGPLPQVLVSSDGTAGIGSPVINMDGAAIGIVHSGAGFREDPRNPLASVLLPPRTFTPASDFMLSLNDPPKADAPIKLPSIGVSNLSGLKKDLAEYFGLKNQPAVQVGDVIPGRAAEKAGLPPGAIIVKVNGKDLERGDDPGETWMILSRQLRRMKVGDAVTFSIVTKPNEPPKDIKIVTQERPMPPNKAERYFAKDLGFGVREMVFDDSYERRLAADAKGVIVTLLQPSSAAQSAKLEPGDMITQINQTPADSLKKFEETYEAFRKSNPHDAIVLEVLRGPNTQIIRVEPPRD
jgi:serine protease Do